MHCVPFIAYCRLSAARQGQSGLRLEAQREVVRRFFGGVPKSEVIAEYVEIESGKRT
ncbi:MAG: hypothetical protein AB7T18_01710 [Alphaproteobacteria bacterium]